MAKVQDIFYCDSGNGLALNALDTSSQDIAFISRVGSNNGVSSFVKRINSLEPFKAGCISVALSGSNVLEAFVQPFDFYTGYHVMVLTPKNPDMTLAEKIYYCQCIKCNRFRYSYNRQANRTLALLELPDTVPEWVKSISSIPDFTLPFKNEPVSDLDFSTFGTFKISDLFDLVPVKSTLINKAKLVNGKTPLVSSTESNNGISCYSGLCANNKGNVLTLNKNGSVGYVFYQESDFLATSDIAILSPKFDINTFIAIFLKVIIEQERFRYNYNRKWSNELILNTTIKLPIKNGCPDWLFMENYIKRLRFSKTISN
ncbi:TPA: hypothetical protein I9094_002570 [Clostridium perfringens]|nr:hypothetical protein [Clostridium perfringens]HAT4347209.1 hypothetical protein [Clostridium perfringens]